MSLTPPRLALSFDELLEGLHALLGREQLELALGLLGLELVQALDALVDRLEVGQNATEPTVVDVRHVRGAGDLCDGVTGLLLGADEQHGSAAAGDVADELAGLVEQLLGLDQVDDVDATGFTVDVAAHFRVPTTGLVPVVDACLQQVFQVRGGSWHRSPGVAIYKLLEWKESKVIRAARFTGEHGVLSRSVRTASLVLGIELRQMTRVDRRAKVLAVRPRATLRAPARGPAGSGEPKVIVLAGHRMIEAELAGVQELARRGRDRRRLRTADRRRPAGRSPPDARGSGACGRFPATRAADCAAPISSTTSKCVIAVARLSPSRIAMFSGLRRSRPSGASIVPLCGLGPALDQRRVLTADLARLQLRPAARAARRRSCAHHQQPGGLLVEPVHDARALGVAAPGAAGQRLRERAGAVARRRMHDKPGGLVDDRGARRPRRRSRTEPPVRSRSTVGVGDQLDRRSRCPASTRVALARGARRRRVTAPCVDQLRRLRARSDDFGTPAIPVEPLAGLLGRTTISSIVRRVLVTRALARPGSCSAALLDREHQHDHAEGDRDVGDVEGREARELDEVAHVAERDAVDRVADRAAEQQSGGEPEPRPTAVLARRTRPARRARPPSGRRRATADRRRRRRRSPRCGSDRCSRPGRLLIVSPGVVASKAHHLVHWSSAMITIAVIAARSSVKCRPIRRSTSASSARRIGLVDPSMRSRLSREVSP